MGYSITDLLAPMKERVITDSYKMVREAYLKMVWDDWRSDKTEHVFYQGAHMGFSLRECEIARLIAAVELLDEALRIFPATGDCNYCINSMQMAHAACTAARAKLEGG